MPINQYTEDNEPLLIYHNENSNIIRKEYYKHGGLKSETEIIQTEKIDTSVVLDYDTQQGRIAIFHSWIDFAHGYHTEYYDSWFDQDFKAQGECQMGKRIGEWLFFDENGHKTIATFDQDGLNGKYREYYFNNQDSTYSLKIDGQLESKYLMLPPKNNSRKSNYSTYHTRRIGTWKYYSKDGTLIGKANFEWYH